MKIAIDARFLGPDGTGIGRYTEELVRHLEQLDKVNEYYLLLRQANFNIFKPTSSNFHRILADVPWYSPKEQVVIPRILRRIQPDLTHFPYDAPPLLAPGMIVTTIHDLTKSDFQSTSASTKSATSYRIKQLAYKFALHRGAERSAKIIVPAHTIKDQVVHDLHISAEKVAVTYEAADDKFFGWGEQKISPSQLASVLQKYHLQPPFIIYVGNAYPYKNLNKLIEALKLLPPELSLVCLGKLTPFHNRLAAFVKEQSLADRVFMPGFVPDEDMAILYRAAAAYTFPTLSEGFGLPAIEAMASRLPVVCSDIPVLREVCGDNALFFDPHDPRDIAAKVAKVLEDKKLREQLVKEGLERAHQFSWRKMAAQTLLVYEESVKGNQ